STSFCPAWPTSGGWTRSTWPTYSIMSCTTGRTASSRRPEWTWRGSRGSPVGRVVGDARRPEFGVSRQQPGLCPVGALQLDQQPGDVALHRGLAEVELPADL